MITDLLETLKKKQEENFKELEVQMSKMPEEQREEFRKLRDEIREGSKNMNIKSLMKTAEKIRKWQGA